MYYGILGYFMYSYFTMLSIYFITIAVFFLPLITVFITLERKKWLVKQFEKEPTTNPEEIVFRKKILKSAEPTMSFPIYKLLKFYLFSVGIITAVLGFLIMVLPPRNNSEARNLLVFIPFILGVVLYFIYNEFYKGQGFWREIAGFFLVGGFAVTAIGAYDLFNMYNWLRSDILLYIVLSFGLLVIHKLKSTIASYVYIIIIIVGSRFVGTGIGNNFMAFMAHFIWFFAIAILYFWIPKLKEAKEIEVKEIIFGLLFGYSILALAVLNTSGLPILALAVTLPYLYLFSKKYYAKGTWFLARPIELIVILLIVLSALALTFSDVTYMAQNSIYLFEHYSFHKQIAYLIIIGILFQSYRMYQDQTEEEKKGINLLILFYPIGAFLAVYFIGEYGTQYLASIFIVYLGYNYIQKGLKLKDSIQIILGSFSLLTGIIIQIEKLKEYITEQSFVGFIVLVIGAMFLGLSLYLRNKWTVTSPKKYEDVDADLEGKNDSKTPDLLDTFEIE